MTPGVTVRPIEVLPQVTEKNCKETSRLFLDQFHIFLLSANFYQKKLALPKILRYHV